MTIPKTLRIFGYDWKVKLVRTTRNGNSGGSFDWGTKTIILSTKYGEEESILLHEVMEAILLHLHFRFYGQEGNMEKIFHFNHTGFVQFHQMFYQVLKDNKLI